MLLTCIHEYMHTSSIYIVMKHNNFNEIFALSLYSLVIVYCYMYIFRTTICTKFI